MNTGFIGLGVIGRPMAGHLIDAGHSLFLNRVNPASQGLVDKDHSGLILTLEAPAGDKS